MDNLDQEQVDADDIHKPKTFAAKVDARRANARLSLTLQRTYEFALREGGKPVLSDDEPIVHHSWVNLQRDILASAAIREFAIGQHKDMVLQLPVGVTAVLGRSGAGKTRLTREFLYGRNQKAKQAVHYIKMFEPGVDEDATDTLHAPMFEVDLALTLAELLMADSADTIIIDSLRYLFYSTTGGATGKGGVNMSLFMALTHLDRVAASLGKRVIVVINPMTDDDVAFNFYVEAASGAVASVVIMDNWLSGRYTNRYAKTREFKTFKLPSDPSSVQRRDAKPKLAMAGGTTQNLRSDLFDRSN